MAPRSGIEPEPARQRGAAFYPKGLKSVFFIASIAATYVVRFHFFN
jgi:hypothetical protein